MKPFSSRYFGPAEDDDSGERTPIHGSGTYPVYRRAAEEIAEKLLKIKDPTATMMAEELIWFANKFGEWSPLNRPDDKTRERLIGEFMNLFNRVHASFEEILFNRTN